MKEANKCIFCEDTINVQLVDLDLENDYLCYNCWKQLKKEYPNNLNLSDEKLFIKNKKKQTMQDKNNQQTESQSQLLIIETCNEIKEMLLNKNRKYGDSALNPQRIFSKADTIEQINVRIDDKLSRKKSRQADEDEDVEIDLLGYLILKKVAMKMLQIKNYEKGTK